MVNKITVDQVLKYKVSFKAIKSQVDNAEQVQFIATVASLLSGLQEQ